MSSDSEGRVRPPARDMRLLLEAALLTLIVLGLGAILLLTSRLDADIVRHAVLGPPETDEAARIDRALVAMDALDPSEARGIVAELGARRLTDPHLEPVLRRLQTDLGSLGRPELPLTLTEWYPAAPTARPTGATASAKLYVFWELWCPHCRVEVPRVARLVEGMDPGQIEVVGVTRMSKGVRADHLRAYLAEQGIDFPTGHDPDGTVFEYDHVRGVPTAFLVKAGEVVWLGNAARVTAERLAEWLAP